MKRLGVVALGSAVAITMASTGAVADQRPVDHDPAAAAVAPAPRAVDATKQVATLGSLGGVTQKVKDLVAAGAPTSGAPDATAVKQRQADLETAAKDLLKQTGGGGGVLAARSGGAHKSVVSVKDAVDKLLKDAGALVDAVTAAKPDAAKIKQAITDVATDELAVVTAVATALGAPGLPGTG